MQECYTITMFLQNYVRTIIDLSIAWVIIVYSDLLQGSEGSEDSLSNGWPPGRRDMVRVCIDWIHPF